MAEPSPPRETLTARAHFLGHRLMTRELPDPRIADTPTTINVGVAGLAFLFRFGVIVLVKTAPDEEKAFLESTRHLVRDPFPRSEMEEARIAIDAGASDRVETGVILLKELSVERLQTVAHVLAKSTVLAHYERQVASVFDHIERIAEQLKVGRIPGQPRQMLSQIGNVLAIQVGTVGRVEVTEKPEMTWDRPELDRLYEHLAVEYELRDRDIALNRKLAFIADTAETYLDLIHTRRGLRVEWYIVVLILIEIGLTLYDLFLRRLD